MAKKRKMIKTITYNLADRKLKIEILSRYLAKKLEKEAKILHQVLTSKKIKPILEGEFSRFEMPEEVFVSLSEVVIESATIKKAEAVIIPADKKENTIPSIIISIPSINEVANNETEKSLLYLYVFLHEMLHIPYPSKRHKRLYSEEERILNKIDPSFNRILSRCLNAT